jgi:hypothetical protein
MSLCSKVQEAVLLQPWRSQGKKELGTGSLIYWAPTACHVWKLPPCRFMATPCHQHYMPPSHYR